MTGYLCDNTPSDMEIDSTWDDNPNLRGWHFPASSSASPAQIAPNVNCASAASSCASDMDVVDEEPNVSCDAAASSCASPMDVVDDWYTNPNFRGWHFPASSTASPMEIDMTWNWTWAWKYSNVGWDPTSLYASDMKVDYTWPWNPALT